MRSFFVSLCFACRSKNQKGKKTDSEDIKVDRKKSASKRTSEEKKPVEVTKTTCKTRSTDTMKTTCETDVGKDDDNTLLSNEGEENVPLNPIEQVTDQDAVQSTLSLRKYLYIIKYGST